jgi:hypothetical protein
MTTRVWRSVLEPVANWEFRGVNTSHSREESVPLDGAIN